MYEARRRSHYQIIHSHRAPSIFGPRDPNVLLFDPHFVSDLTLTGSRCGVPGRSCSVIWSTSHDLAPPDHRRGRTGELSERTNDRSRGFALVHARSRCLFLHVVQITTKQRNPRRGWLKINIGLRLYKIYSAGLDCYEEWMVMRDKYFVISYISLVDSILPVIDSSGISWTEHGLTPHTNSFSQGAFTFVLNF